MVRTIGDAIPDGVHIGGERPHPGLSLCFHLELFIVFYNSNMNVFRKSTEKNFKSKTFCRII